MTGINSVSMYNFAPETTGSIAKKNVNCPECGKPINFRGNSQDLYHKAVETTGSVAKQPNETLVNNDTVNFKANTYDSYYQKKERKAGPIIFGTLATCATAFGLLALAGKKGTFKPDSIKKEWLSKATSWLEKPSAKCYEWGSWLKAHSWDKIFKKGS